MKSTKRVATIEFEIISSFYDFVQNDLIEVMMVWCIVGSILSFLNF